MRGLAAGLCVVAAALTGPPSAASAEEPASSAPSAPAAPSVEQQSKALERAAASVDGLQSLAVDEARSAGTLGRARQGSGVVIAEDGLVLTIGYLILEAEQVQIITDDQRHVPARVVAYDLATGFGLVRPLVPLGLAPAPLGASAQLLDDEPLMAVNGGDSGSVSATRLVSRRAFSGYWEYHLEDALFTSPPLPAHSGAGLFNSRGELVGIGSLFVADAAGPNAPRMAGNMYVPVDLLRAALPEMLVSGRSHSSERAWIGVSCVEVEGRIRVIRVSEDSPADVAGLEVGDRIVAIDGQPVSALEQLWKRLWSGSAAERAVRLEIERDGQAQTMTVQAVDRAKTLRRAEGI
jgi:S1-C subfamily serine protease